MITGCFLYGADDFDDESIAIKSNMNSWDKMRTRIKSDLTLFPISDPSK